ncbi:hypothetical protein HNQ92_000010 [Rhabdobacter roseus]|uniref:Uncharacterized protein n=1 Tax=Rhabdobacter roseus TaxID=1655419 RepID=A0A840TQ63_9BACT|nr:hypothetical protein [Rhabdobacter roseus]MBB5281889.1 hypothetical protein [Rhabdobacter roseus]
MKQSLRKSQRSFFRPPRLAFVLVAAMGAVLSCEKKEPEPDCGCEGTYSRTIDSLIVHHAGNGLFVARNPENNSPEWLFSACQEDTSWVVSTSEAPYYYLVSGQEKVQCPFPGGGIPFFPNSPIVITSIVPLK